MLEVLATRFATSSVSERVYISSFLTDLTTVTLACF